jgi:pimeloyl-ACP methyl ester carboxylesterase
MHVIIAGAAGLTLLAAAGGALVLFTWYTRRRIEAALPPRGSFVTVAGSRMHIVRRGAGRPLVLVHGLGAQLGNFTYALTKRLEAHFHLICVDRPGCGYSTPLTPSALAHQASAIAALLETLDVQKPIIVGHSYGGALALALALNHPERVAGLALIAPVTHVQPRTPAPFRGLLIPSPLLRKIVAWTLAAPLGMVQGRRLLEQVFHPEPVPRDLGSAGGGLLALRPQHFITACTDLVNLKTDLPQIMPRYSSIRVPVGILFGRSDAILSPSEHGYSMEGKIPGLIVSVIDGGHMLPITAPDPTARWIAEFAERVR